MREGDVDMAVYTIEYMDTDIERGGKFFTDKLWDVDDIVDMLVNTTDCGWFVREITVYEKGVTGPYVVLAVRGGSIIYGYSKTR